MSNSARNQDVTIAKAIQALQANRPEVAEEICLQKLSVQPDSLEHIRLLGHVYLKQKKISQAQERFEYALSKVPDFAPLMEDLGTALAMQGKLEKAVEYFQAAIDKDSSLVNAQKKLGHALSELGRTQEADQAFESFLTRDPMTTEIAVGADHMRAGRDADAMKSFKSVLRKDPNNVDAMRFLAAIYRKVGRNIDDAEALLTRATQIAPDFVNAWLDLGQTLIKRRKMMDAIDAYKKAGELDPDNFNAWSKLASAYATAGYPEEATVAFEKALAIYPESPSTHLGFGHVLKTTGDQPASLRAYREAIRLKPDFGEVYWSMANLKTFKFEDAEVSAMHDQLENSDLQPGTEAHFRFALGKAYEDRKDFDKAWHYYHSGNELQRTLVQHDPVANSMRQEAVREYFTKEQLSANEGNGYPDEAPIFIVGLGRSGSTLVEQILASHSMVEGTEELSILGKLADSIGRFRNDDKHYPKILDEMRPGDWRALGLEYLEGAKRYRMTDKPIFTDKLPNNFPFVGLIHLILPNAKIINARRHPLDACLGNYKQLFGRGQNHTYDMFDLGDYYKEYCLTMDHWNDVLPGKVLDIHYEETVTDLEGTVARILDHCGLPFEEQCIRFHETERAVKTASSEQVRQPIYKGGLGKWRKYEDHLDEWKELLGDVIDGLPDVVKNAGL